VTATVRLAVVVPFLDEERLLPVLLESIAAQERPPERLLLVDDGSRDGSAALAEAFAARRPYAAALRRPTRDAGADRLAGAHELRAFAGRWTCCPVTGTSSPSSTPTCASLPARSPAWRRASAPTPGSASPARGCSPPTRPARTCRTGRGPSTSRAR
jgi:glycosyltransferase involved in cell wall biosynthesis